LWTAHSGIIRVCVCAPSRGRARYRKDPVDLSENLRDLTFEHRAGKLPDADFQSMRGAMEDEAATLLAEIEVLEGQGNGGGSALLSSAPSTSRQSK
jgi:hypothetical protein